MRKILWADWMDSGGSPKKVGALANAPTRAFGNASTFILPHWLHNTSKHYALYELDYTFIQVGAFSNAPTSELDHSGMLQLAIPNKLEHSQECVYESPRWSIRDCLNFFGRAVQSHGNLKPVDVGGYSVCFWGGIRAGVVGVVQYISWSIRQCPNFKVESFGNAPTCKHRKVGAFPGMRLKMPQFEHSWMPQLFWESSLESW